MVEQLTIDTSVTEVEKPSSAEIVPVSEAETLELSKDEQEENLARSDVELRLAHLFRNNEEEIEEIFKVLIRQGGPNLVDIYLKNHFLNSTANKVLPVAHGAARKIGLRIFHAKVPGILTEWLFEQVELEFLKSKELEEEKTPCLDTPVSQRLRLVDNPTVQAYEELKLQRDVDLAKAEVRLAGARRRILQLSMALGVSLFTLTSIGGWTLFSTLNEVGRAPEAVTESVMNQ